MMNEKEEPQKIDPKTAAIPYTAYLNAYYRAQETKKEHPLFTDPLAERFAEDISHLSLFLKERSGVQIARHHYIDSEVIRPWCGKHETSQIVLLGAGFDTRAYRLDSLGTNDHTIFEIDLPPVIDYKKRLLLDVKPLCKLIRFSSNLSQPVWSNDLMDHGFSSEVPTLWLLEGFAYYIEKDTFLALLQKACKISAPGSELFADICVPALAGLDFGPYSSHFKWGLALQDAIPLFASTGWDVTSCFADDHDYGRDVGQKGTIYVRGVRAPEKISQVSKMPSVSFDVSPEDIPVYAEDFTREVLPTIEQIISDLERSTTDGLASFLDFVQQIKPVMELFATIQETPLNLGHISPRLLGDPLSIEGKVSSLEPAEIESHIVGHLKAILSISYCSIFNLVGQQFHDTDLYTLSKGSTSIDSLSPLLKHVKTKLDSRR